MMVSFFIFFRLLWFFFWTFLWIFLWTFFVNFFVNLFVNFFLWTFFVNFYWEFFYELFYELFWKLLWTFCEHFLDDDDDYHVENGVQQEFLSESGGVAVVDDVAIKDEEVEQVLDEFSFLGPVENDSEWNPNKQIIDQKKDQLIQERRRKRPPRTTSPRKVWSYRSWPPISD